MAEDAKSNKATIRSFFDEIPLPFSYLDFPYLTDPPRPRHPYLTFSIVNGVISELTHRYFNKAGFPHTADPNKWNLSWGNQFDPPEYSQCRPWQKISHFAGAFLVGRKDELDHRMAELATRLSSPLDFYPQSFLLRSADFAPIWNSRRFWIVKDFANSKADGIRILDSSRDKLPTSQSVIQTYIEKPLLVTNRKFDVRLYVLVTSMAPLRVYLHEFGLVRFATHEYHNDVSDLCSHLTNVSVNRESKDFEVDKQKLSLQNLYEILSQNGIDVIAIQRQFERIVAMTMVAAATPIRQYHQKLIQHRHTAFELYGFDVLIDSDLHCWLLEVNVSPSMSGLDCEFDRIQKAEITAEMYNIGRVIDCDPGLEKPCPAVEKYDGLWKESIMKSARESEGWNWESPGFADLVLVRDYLEEKQRVKRFRRVFPRRRTVREYRGWFGQLGYCDRSFLAWMEMDDRSRLEALRRGRDLSCAGVLQCRGD
jgi:tubulin polyglutamylase TTLL4